MAKKSNTARRCGGDEAEVSESGRWTGQSCVRAALGQAEGGTAFADVCRQIGGQRGHVPHLEEDVRAPGRGGGAPAACARPRKENRVLPEERDLKKGRRAQDDAHYDVRDAGVV